MTEHNLSVNVKKKFSEQVTKKMSKNNHSSTN